MDAQRKRGTRRKTDTKKYGTRITVPLTKEQMTHLEEWADSRDVTIAEYIRLQVFDGSYSGDPRSSK